MTVCLKRLTNGLTVLTEEVHHAPVVAMQAWVHVGSADERPEMAGAAHLHEHMLFKGTERRGVGEIARVAEASGGEVNAWTSFDQTAYHVVLESGDVDTGLDLLSDALRNSTFDAEELSREIEVVVEEIQRAEDSPARRISNALFDLAYQEHRYRYPVLGSRESVRAMTREQILDFYRSHYRPDQITFVAVGDFDTEAIHARIAHFFGDWENPEREGRRPRVQEGPQTEFRFRVLEEDVKQARFSVAWHIPEVSHQDIPAIDALGMILGHGDSSRLYCSVRQDRQLVNGIHAHAYTPQDPGLFVVGAGLKAENLREALSLSFEEVFRSRNGISEAELEKAKVVLLSDSAYLRETMQGQARKLGFYQVVAGGFDREEAYREAVEALSTADIEGVARRYLSASPTLVIQVPEGSEVPERQEALGLLQEAFESEEVSGYQRNEEGAMNLRPRPAPVGVDTTVGPLGVSRAELPNGCTLLVRQEDVPVMGIRAAALGGLRWEGVADSGLANLFASLWCGCTERWSEEALAEQSALLGGGISTFTGRNTLGIRADFLQDRGLHGLELFCDVLLNSQFVPEHLDRERATIVEHIRNRADHPSMVAFEEFTRALYPHHPFGQRLMGSEATLATFDAGSLEALGAQFTTPDKMVISVVSNWEAAEVIDRLGDRLGGIQGRPLPAAPSLDEPLTAFQSFHLPSEKQQSHVVLGGRGTTLMDRDKYVFEVMTTILSGQSGRLFLDLRDKQSLAYTVSASSVEALDPGYVYVYMATSPDKLSQALGGLHGHLDRLRNDLVSEVELQRAIRYLVGTHSIDLQRGGARAMMMALGERFGLGYDQYTRYVEEIERVTAEDIRRVAQAYLDPQALVQVVVGPK